MKKKCLSIALAVYNEENFLRACLESIRGIADEINIVDGGSTDKSVDIALSIGQSASGRLKFISCLRNIPVLAKITAKVTTDSAKR